MIKLFRNNETNFNHNEFVLNEIISCKPTEAINDDYTAELEYPLEDSKGISSNLVVGGIVSIPAIDNRLDQLFRIINKETSLTTVTVQMQAKLLADLKENRVRAMTLTGLTRKQAIQAVLNAALDPHNYTVGSLDTNTNTNVIVNIPEGNLLSAIIGAENSILSAYGGEFIVNNNTIDIVDSRGSDNGVVIEYGKNLSSIKESINLTDLATVLIPKSGDYRLPEYSIESPLVGAYEKRYFKEVDLNLNIWDGTNTKGDDQVTIEEAYALMRTACSKMFTVDKVDQISFNYEVDFVQLSQTEEYKNYAILETVNLGDTVTIRHKVLNLDLQGRVNKISYSIDSEGNTTIDKVEIGFSRKEITDIINNTIKQIKFTKDQINLQITDTAKSITAAFTIADNAIKQSVTDTKNALQAEIDINSTKINAVVEQDNTGFGWELSKEAFKVACVGASGAYVIININGLEVDDGRFKLKKNGNTVFYVNTSGRCTADGGFVVEDGDTECTINADGVRLTNSNGYTGLLEAHPSRTGLFVPDDFYVGSKLGVTRYSYFDANLDVEKNLWVGGDFDVDGEKNCLQITQNYGKRRINAYETAEYYFGDIGQGIIKDGECIIYIEDIFSECINTNITYQVQIFEYACRGSITKIERYPSYFIVKGNIDNIEFGWELKAKRIGYENNRLEQRLEKEDFYTDETENTLLENKNTNLSNTLLENEDSNLIDILLQEVV